MNKFDQFLAFLRDFRTEEILRFIKESQISELINTPYFLGSVVIIILLCLLMKWRLLLATVVGLVGFAELLAYTTARDTSLSDGLGNETLIIFVGGGVTIVSLVIYLLFIRSE
ncbi:MAG: hypothetical protein IBX47_05080 [Desulfuromonadales bacterium]|nr:hypothetical protein [Desulfuromonadales bacterium]